MTERKDQDEPTLIDGLKLLLQDNHCNLGWRIVVKELLSPDEFRSILIRTHSQDAANLADLVHQDQLKHIRSLLAVLRGIRDGKQVEEEKLNLLLDSLGIDPVEGIIRSLRDTVQLPSSKKAKPGVREIPVTITTIQSAKGLSADYVFLTFFDDRFWIRSTDNDIVDQDICGFLVALTRARRRVLLLTTDIQSRPTFLSWIDESRLHTTECPGTAGS